jgi:vacuolar protein sorting-associated protein VTA1
MASSLPAPTQLPPSLRPIAHYLKTGVEYETRDPVITYWCRLAALQVK